VRNQPASWSIKSIGLLGLEAVRLKIHFNIKPSHTAWRNSDSDFIFRHKKETKGQKQKGCKRDLKRIINDRLSYKGEGKRKILQMGFSRLRPRRAGMLLGRLGGREMPGRMSKITHRIKNLRYLDRANPIQSPDLLSS